jgi:hypothetical protein
MNASLRRGFNAVSVTFQYAVLACLAAFLAVLSMSYLSRSIAVDPRLATVAHAAPISQPEPMGAVQRQFVAIFGPVDELGREAADRFPLQETGLFFPVATALLLGSAVGFGFRPVKRKTTKAETSAAIDRSTRKD